MDNPRKNAEGYNDPTPYAAEKHMMAQIRGKQARVAGGYFENIISASCDYYLSRGLAKIEKTPEPMKPLGAKNRKGQFLACYTKQAQPDYGGTLKGGRSIYFEAKHTDDERIEPHGNIELAAEWPAVEIEAGELPPPDESAGTQLAKPSDDAPEGELAIELPPAIAPEADTASLHIEAGPPFAPPFRPEWPDASELELKAEPATPPLDFDSLLHRQDSGDTGSAPTPESLDTAPVAAPLIAPPPRKDEDASPDTWPGPAASDDNEVEAETTEEKPSGMLRQAAWAAGATLLALVLLAQGVLVFRNQIVQSSPHMRPLMENLCAGIGCDLPLPRDATLIAIESSDIQPDASREAFFTLHVTLRNRAEFAQAHPHLEVTLTDARDKPLVRRVLEPAQWLPADAPKDAFPAHREIASQVAFEAPMVAAAGYRVWVFYP